MKIDSSFLNILPLNNFPKINYTPKISFTGSNLAPLDKDTVTFSGTQKTESSSKNKKLDPAERGSRRLTTEIHRESDNAYSLFKYILGTVLDETIIDLDEPDAQTRIKNAIDENKNKPILYVTSRRKKPNSIAEKMGQLHIRSKAQVRNNMNDIIGARIIVSGVGTKEGDYVLDKLTQGVKETPLKIKKIKNHGQQNPRLKYTTQKALDKLITASRKNGSPTCEYVDQPRDSGYLAVHLLTENIADGFSAEIQIMGLDVERFKEIEDLCYKCHAGKGVGKKYKEIEDLFKPYRGDEDFMAQYLEYTKRAYKHERLKPLHNKDEFSEFLPIPDDLDLIPKELDFNNIRKIKNRIDHETNPTKNPTLK